MPEATLRARLNYDSGSVFRMASLRDQFQHFYAPDEQAVAAAIKTGLVVPDTNVLLSLYRFQRAARDQILSLFEKIGDRLWIPHQVGLEYHRNRLNVIYEQGEYFGKTLKDLNDSIDSICAKVHAFRSRIALGIENVHEIENNITRLRDVIGREVKKAEEANQIFLDDHASDEVLALIDDLFENRVGEPMGAATEEEVRAEARRRADDGIPPGYKDKNKDKGDPDGDYIIWWQLISEANERKVPVVLITGDRKEDWYETFKGRTLGARRELRKEMMSRAAVPLLIMTTETFLLQAGEYLDVEVSPETVDQAKELPALAVNIETPGEVLERFHRQVAERILVDIEMEQQMVYEKLNELTTQRAVIEGHLRETAAEIESFYERMRDGAMGVRERMRFNELQQRRDRLSRDQGAVTAKIEDIQHRLQQLAERLKANKA